MAKKRDVVKVVNIGGAKPSGIAAGIAALVGIAAGAGATRALDKRPKMQRGGSILPDEKPGDEKSGPIGPFDHDAAGVAKGKEGSPKGKVLAFAEKKDWKWLGRLLQVQARFGELNGGNIASAVTLQIFLALFPLLILASAVAGFFVRGSGERVNEQIFNFLGVTDSAAQETISGALETASSGAGLAALIGFVTLLWSALGIASALEYAYNQSWQASNRGIKDKAVGLAWLVGAALLFGTNAALAVGVSVLPKGFGVLTLILSIGVTFVLWIFTAVVLPNVKVSWRDVVPGAIVGTVGLQAIQYAAGFGASAAGGSESGAYGAFGVALSLIAALLIFGRIVVYSAVTNVVVYEGKHGITKGTIQMPVAVAKDADDVARGGTAED